MMHANRTQSLLHNGKKPLPGELTKGELEGLNYLLRSGGQKSFPDARHPLVDFTLNNGAALINNVFGREKLSNKEEFERLKRIHPEVFDRASIRTISLGVSTHRGKSSISEKIGIRGGGLVVFEAASKENAILMLERMQQNHHWHLNPGRGMTSQEKAYIRRQLALQGHITKEESRARHERQYQDRLREDREKNLPVLPKYD